LLLGAQLTTDVVMDGSGEREGRPEQGMDGRRKEVTWMISYLYRVYWWLALNDVATTVGSSNHHPKNIHKVLPSQPKAVSPLLSSCNAFRGTEHVSTNSLL
jgi:hypothetical protein